MDHAALYAAGSGHELGLEVGTHVGSSPWWVVLGFRESSEAEGVSAWSMWGAARFQSAWRRTTNCGTGTVPTDSRYAGQGLYLYAM